MHNRFYDVYLQIRKLAGYVKRLFGYKGYIRNYILFPVGAFCRKKRLFPYFNKCEYIADMKDKYAGKRCFIIATGPSLRLDDVSKLEDEFTIALNSFWKTYKYSSFRPTYYLSLDPDYADNLIKEGISDCSGWAKDKAFFNSVNCKKIKNGYSLWTCWKNHWYSICFENYDLEKNLKFSKNLLEGIYDKYTVTAAAIELAIYNGSREIYLLGVDCNYSGKDQYFIKEKNRLDIESARRAERADLVAYTYLKKICEESDIKIYNASRGGNLEVFNRVVFDELEFH